MLGPDYILRLSEGAEQIASELHGAVLRAVVRRIMLRLAAGKDFLLTTTDKWQLETLQQAGFLMSDLEEEIAAATRLQRSEVRAAFEDAGIVTTRYDNDIYQKAGLNPASLRRSPYLLRLLQRGYESTMGEWSNYTRTTANTAQQLFIRACDLAYTQVAAGVRSLDGAVADAVRLAATDGATVVYPSGWRDTIEVATMRAVRTGVSQTCAEITEARMDEMDWDIVLTSAHLGARYGDGGDNFTNHYWWQGKFYSRSGKDPRFPPFEVCGEGEVQGIFGPNCRHSIGPGDGINNPFEKYDSEENKKAYDLSQEQRAMERAIRKTKQEAAAYQEAIENSQTENPELQQEYVKEITRLQKQNLEYNRFCAENDLPTQEARLQTVAWTREQNKAAMRALEEQETVLAADASAFTFDIDKARADFEKALEVAPERERELLGFTYLGAEFVEDRELKSAFTYRPSTDQIHFNPQNPRISEFSPVESLAHELAHRADQKYIHTGNDAAVFVQDMLPGLVDYIKAHYQELFRLTQQKDLAGVSDIFHALARGSLEFKYGHSVKYWKNDKKVIAEIFADVVTIYFTKNDKAKAVLRKHIPKLLQWYESLIFGDLL